MDYDTLEQRGYPKSAILDILAWFALYGEPDNCQDNERVALVGNAEEERRYREIQAAGCCGFTDDTLESGGQVYLVGFNSGH